MVAKIVIRDIPGANGEYELDLGRFTNEELRLIKRESGVRAGEIEEAMRALDNDLVVCFALIAIKRSGNVAVPALLWEAEIGRIDLDLSDEGEDDVLPPASAGDSPESESAKPESSSSSGNDDSADSQES